MADKDRTAEKTHDEENLSFQLSALMEALPFATWFKDATGRFNQVNRKMLYELGKEAKEVLGRGNDDVFDSEEARNSDEGDRDALENGGVCESTYSKNHRFFKSVRFPVYNPQGKVTGTGGYQEDITNLTASLQSLHREREYLEALLENMPFYISFIDRHHRYIRINSKMAGLLRLLHPEEAIGKSTGTFFSPRVARKMLEEDRHVLDSGKPIINRIIYFEDEGVDGFWMENNKIPIKDERGVITMIVAIFKDVTDMVRIETELKNARDRARESDRLKTSFLANMSHEIRTPMNGILGFANLLRDPDISQENRDLYLKHIEYSSNQLMNIIDDIIDISKIESGQLKISNKPIRINAILDELYSSYFHRIRGDAPGQKKVAFKLVKGDESPNFTVVCDDFRLSQVFHNLIGNAIKFTPEGRFPSATASKNNRHIEFFVSDTGIGIPPEKREIIFERFGQVDDRKGAHKGTGLGLPISKNLISLMGGEMWLETAEGQGSTFYFTLPLVVESEVEEGHVLISNKTYNWPGKLILVAEDEEMNWFFIREMLRKSGAEIVRAKNGVEAVEFCRRGGPDIVLMDLKMPELDGMEATREIRSFDTDIPIIAQTAHVMAEEKEECKKAGCNFFVTKPIDRTILMEYIDRYFRTL
ncbi:MAG: ATP-binding protein [Bacteroidales bacterium]